MPPCGASHFLNNQNSSAIQRLKDGSITRTRTTRSTIGRKLMRWVLRLFGIPTGPLLGVDHPYISAPTLLASQRFVLTFVSLARAALHHTLAWQPSHQDSWRTRSLNLGHRRKTSLGSHVAAGLYRPRRRPRRRNRSLESLLRRSIRCERRKEKDRLRGRGRRRGREKRTLSCDRIREARDVTKK